MNAQREVIYGERNKVVDDESVHEYVMKMFPAVISKYCEKCVDDEKPYFDWDYAKINHIEDPMAFFFEGVKKYNHGLYIAKTNLSILSQRVKINYQYLCTLNLTPSEFESLVNEHIEYIEEIKNNPNLQNSSNLYYRKKRP